MTLSTETGLSVDQEDRLFIFFLLSITPSLDKLLKEKIFK
jgi:hypothetical protein